ncbi:MAG: hypothetical protein L7S55_07280 [Luminiphilus sp.]|nr:hypothetical protein [Luminiphilus sp.]
MKQDTHMPQGTLLSRDFDCLCDRGYVHVARRSFYVTRYSLLQAVDIKYEYERSSHLDGVDR